MTTLTFGAVVFQGFEIPEVIPYGGSQELAVHKLPGGGRVIDAMGPDDRDITWTGRFRGSQAESRSRMLDGYRKAGKPLMLTWGSNRYQAVIRSYEPEYRQSYEIPYAITFVVIPPPPPAASGPFNLLNALGPDLTKMVTLGGAINVSTINSAVTSVQSAISTAQSVYSTAQTAIGAAQGVVGAAQSVISAVKDIKAGGLTNITNIGDALSGAQTAVLGATTQVEGALSSVGLFTPGNSPSALVSTLTSTANGFSQLNNLYQMGNTLARMGKNLSTGI